MNPTPTHLRAARRASLAMALAALFACGGEQSDAADPAGPDTATGDGAPSTTADCVGCHTDKAMILATAEPVQEVSGEAADSGET